MAITVIGAAHWDVIGRAAAPLGPGGDVPGRIRRRIGGVAANVALALAARGRAVRLHAAIGADPEGAALRAGLCRGGVALAPLPAAPRTDAYVAVEAADGAVAAAVADCAGLDALGARLLEGLDPRAEAVVADGNLPAAALGRLAAAAPARRVLVGASPAKAPRLARTVAGAAVYLNRAEAEAVAGRAFAGAAEAAAGLLALGAAAALVTDGAGPACAADGAGAASLAPPAAAAGGRTGAGDALVAAHLDAVLGGAPAGAALAAALAAAARHLARAEP